MALTKKQERVIEEAWVLYRQWAIRPLGPGTDVVPLMEALRQLSFKRAQEEFRAGLAEAQGK